MGNNEYGACSGLGLAGIKDLDLNHNRVYSRMARRWLARWPSRDAFVAPPLNRWLGCPTPPNEGTGDFLNVPSQSRPYHGELM
jgi:hypothetical protein